jgi:hypothetical protein
MERMTDFAGLPPSDRLHASQERAVDVQSAGRRPNPSDASSAAPANRFGAAAGLFDQLDLRPLELRMRRRPWWRFW